MVETSSGILQSGKAKQWGVIDNATLTTLPLSFTAPFGAFAIPRAGGTDWSPYILLLSNTQIKIGSPQSNNFYMAYGKG